MSDHKTEGRTDSQNHLRGVKCDVVNCIYNDKHEKCTANQIRVGPQYASTSDETICDTFKPQ